MSTLSKYILPSLDDSVYFGTNRQKDLFQKIENIEEVSPHTILHGGRNTGKTELVKKFYNTLFYNKNKTIPFFYAFPCTPYDSNQFSIDFFTQTVKQFVGFITKDPAAIHRKTPLSELNNLIDDKYIHLKSHINNFIKAVSDTNRLCDLPSAFCLPHLISIDYEFKSIVLIDDFHFIYNFPPSLRQKIVREIESASHPLLITYLFTCPTLSLLSSLFSPSFIKSFTFKKLTGLSLFDCEKMWNYYCMKNRNEIQNKDLPFILSLFFHNPFYIKNISHALVQTGLEPITIKGIFTVYIEQLFDGNIHLFFSSILSIIPPAFRKMTITLCYELIKKDCIDSEAIPFTIGCKGVDADRIITILSLHGIVEKSGSAVTISNDPVLKDYIELLFLLEIKRKNFNRLKGRLILKKLSDFKKNKDYLKKGEEIVGLKAILETFSNQTVPNILFNYTGFTETLKNNSSEQIRVELENRTNCFLLPETVGTVENENCSRNNPFVIVTAYCYRKNSPHDEVWVTGNMLNKKNVSVVEAQLYIQASAELELKEKGKRVVKWLLSPEGFNPGALEVLQSNGVLTSNLAQISILQDIISKKKKNNTPPSADSYTFKLLLPIGDEIELVAAKTVEEVAKKGKFDKTSTNQIKMAIIEACINAFDYTVKKDSMISITFILKKNMLTIYIENEGWGFDPAYLAEPNIENKIYGNYKRGWGLKIMKNLMDEVRFDKVKNYTRLILVKYISNSI